MDALEQYLANAPLHLHDLIRSTDALIRSALPGLIASIKWGNLTYHGNANVCAIIAHRQYVNLQLWGATDIDDPGRLLQGSGKQMRHVKLMPQQIIDRRAITSLLLQAARLRCPHHPGI